MYLFSCLLIDLFIYLNLNLFKFKLFAHLFSYLVIYSLIIYLFIYLIILLFIYLLIDFLTYNLMTYMCGLLRHDCRRPDAPPPGLAYNCNRA